jgi:hypothetical protein
VIFNTYTVSHDGSVESLHDLRVKLHMVSLLGSRVGHEVSYGELSILQGELHIGMTQ